MMNKSRCRRSSTLVILWIIVFWHQILSVVCERVQQQFNNEDQKLSFFQLLSTSIDLFKRSHLSFWQNFKSVIYQFQLHFAPPNLDFRRRETIEGKESESVRENMKEAVRKSIRTGEAALKGTAKSAAKVVQKTADKVKKKKNTVSQSHDEL
ncbi:transmembrane protein [Gossypium australe]|uniref:Transmembrane protein n=1 Tax=Gossypium australe TaxID=47621 RepID=A0A5B6W2U4_9ROSI|nr:transmembrane protein [Gossypium australe]